MLRNIGIFLSKICVVLKIDKNIDVRQVKSKHILYKKYLEWEFTSNNNIEICVIMRYVLKMG